MLITFWIQSPIITDPVHLEDLDPLLNAAFTSDGGSGLPVGVMGDLGADIC